MTTRSSVWAWTIPLVTSSEVSRVAVSTNSSAPAEVRTSATNRLACRALSGAGGSVTWRCSPLIGTEVVLRGQANPPEGSLDPFTTMLTTQFGAADRVPAHPIGRIGHLPARDPLSRCADYRFLPVIRAVDHAARRGIATISTPGGCPRPRLRT